MRIPRRTEVCGQGAQLTTASNSRPATFHFRPLFSNLGTSVSVAISTPTANIFPRRLLPEREKNSEKQLEALAKGREKLKKRHFEKKIQKEEDNEAMRVLIEATKRNTDIINELKYSIKIQNPPNTPESPPPPSPPKLQRQPRIFV